MSGIGFATALSALTTAQQALQTIGHNVSNAATPGFSRQVVSLRTRMPVAGRGGALVGSGVQVGRIDRVIDSLLETRLRSQRSELGRQTTLRDHFLELESLFSEPSSAGLSATLSSFFAELSGAPVDPANSATRTSIAQSGVLLADSINSLRRQMTSILDNIDAEVKTAVNGVNELTTQLEEINRELSRSSQRHGAPPDLLDRQDQLLKQLGDVLNIQADKNERGLITVTSGGTLLVSPVGAIDLKVEAGAAIGDPPIVSAKGSTQPLNPRGGRLSALLEIAGTSVDKRIAAMDRLAHNIILEMNRVHTTGVPLDGGYTSLISSNQLGDQNGNGSFLDEQLSNANLPFDIQDGRLIVNITDTSTGNITRTEIPINKTTTTVGDLVNSLSSIDHLTANVDPLGQLRLNAEGGFRFDFSNRLLPTSDLQNTFGSAQATIVGGTGPFNLAAGSSFTISVQSAAPQTVTFNAAQFADITQATAAEVAAAINSQVTGATAEVAGGRLVVRDNGQGPQSSIQLTNGAGNPLNLLGLSQVKDIGADHSVAVSLSGAYTSDLDQQLTFEPVGSGQIGTGSLLVNVKDAQGNLVASLDVGANYKPDTPLELIDGVSISFGAGSISATSGDTFNVNLVGDSDSSDVLVGLGLGGFFTGQDASDMAVSQNILDDGRLMAGALSGAPGDGSNFLRMLAVQGTKAKGLDNLTTEDFYTRIITDLGVESSRVQSTTDTQELVLQSLEARRDSISGVNIDEELLKLEQFQQIFQVAGRFLQTMQEVNDVLINLVR